MAAKLDKRVWYICVGCHIETEVKSTKLRHRPEGYYFAVRRVTEAGNHYVTPTEVYVCSKTCAEDYVKYGMSRSFEEA